MQFRQWFENNDQLQILVKSLEEQYPEIEHLFAWENDHEVHLHDITIHADKRNQGVGSIVMGELKKFAASVGKPLVLSPEADKGKKAALDRFYRRNGMVHNKGRNKDYRLGGAFGPSMYWKPDN